MLIYHGLAKTNEIKILENRSRKSCTTSLKDICIELPDINVTKTFYTWF